MPLLDHFHPPIYPVRRWESFHSQWIGEMMAALNQGVLPEGYFAEAQVHFGGRVEVDVATLEQSSPSDSPTEEGNGGVAVQTVPATATFTMPASFPDEVEVLIFRRFGGLILVGAIELISPGNKDRPESRRAFAAKCASYLQNGVGLLVVDIVTERRANLHDELVEVMGLNGDYRFPLDSALSAVSYRPFRPKQDDDRIEVRPAALDVGRELPTLRLALRGGPTVMIELDATYTRARQRSQL